jgi:LDH2 family malate/lactate/ureidoglycolate dehydrogenase
MRVSHSELTALCRRAFEGLGFLPGDHEDAADMVVWLQQHGLGGVEALRRGLDHLASEPRRPMARVFEDSALSVLDVRGNSTLLCGGLAVDLVYTQARQRGLGVVRVHNCYNRRLMLGYLTRCARRGMNLLAFWRDREAPDDANPHSATPPVIEQVVSIRAYEDYPTLLLYRIEDVDEARAFDRSVTLIASPHFALLESLNVGSDDATLLEVVEPGGFERQARRALDEGLDVDADVWNRLKSLADRTLVEDTPPSRQQGAGESAP